MFIHWKCVVFASLLTNKSATMDHTATTNGTSIPQRAALKKSGSPCARGGSTLTVKFTAVVLCASRRHDSPNAGERVISTRQQFGIIKYTQNAFRKKSN